MEIHPMKLRKLQKYLEEGEKIGRVGAYLKVPEFTY